MTKQWTTVKITAEQQALIKKIIKELPELGYKSVGDFVADAIRELIVELRKQKIGEKELLRIKKEPRASPDQEPDLADPRSPH